MRLTMHDAWLAEGTQRFGSNPLDWRFVCPSCGHVASVRDWSDAGAELAEIATVCVGTRKNAAHGATLRASGGPCHYRGDGLFALNSVRVVFHDGRYTDLFEFFTPPTPQPAVPRETLDPVASLLARDCSKSRYPGGMHTWREDGSACADCGRPAPTSAP